uniref:Uncharacterized protein n=1 Tax=Candidatus Kentrum eta TaxID=2126337 RepID=A0A450UZT0_9GAMM|nr:MAG: hypothetical protein BECKH772A_GA0070896_100199 [Candidatus Kentron sp. H]VFJ91395.1 MAG: hypothetical protein BECKH772B_GA0070898_100179 [Candidatus Kentron sp. H]VFJ98068.1 MAG: hypothetical protein BECKH772C_GA0070978_100189 [Candidatus Kentron sp. H]
MDTRDCGRAGIRSAPLAERIQNIVGIHGTIHPLLLRVQLFPASLFSMSDKADTFQRLVPEVKEKSFAIMACVAARRTMSAKACQF